MAAALLCVLLAPGAASAQLTCTQEGYTREAPYCFNAPGTRAPGPTETQPMASSNADARVTPLQSCPDGQTFGRTLWMAVHPHAAGSLAIVAIGIDARMVIEDVATGEKVCSDDSFDEGSPTMRESLAVRGLEAGKTYLVQIGGRTRGSGSPATGDFAWQGGFVPDPAGGGSGGGGGGSGGGGGGGGTTTPGGLAPDDPDPDMDGIRGAKDKCPGKGTRGRDLNQDGCEDRKRQEIDVKWRIVPTSGRGVIMRELRLSGAPKGGKVTVKCSRGCKKQTLKLTKSRLNVSASKLRAGRLKPGTTIEVSVARPGYNGTTYRYTVKKTTMTQTWKRCLPEGKSTPVKGACY
ncbi:hypothetical protein OJ997_18075 [Solirubrobacter phytolaccae]|uniref:Uncharacterized protein n=1 Tax=Solirubrobacter phytolaccae TaxID=1404360 RepID=A0A9X3N9X5_9ACTN|nr:hypothetical protein [Solirubrobacter phytolaccae]MDA0182219.1 hypothetical protein [Solirubrobacter phytolaccae]